MPRRFLEHDVVTCVGSVTQANLRLVNADRHSRGDTQA